MTLRIIRPIEIGDAQITSSNVALETEWVAGTYNLGDRRRVGELLYEVSAASTVQEPTPTATEWFSVGPANRYAAFDQQIGLDQYRVIETVTSNADSISYTLDGLTRISGIGFFGLVATTVSIVATDQTTGDILDLTYNIKDDSDYNGSVWRWMFLPQSLERQYLNLNLNIPVGVTVEITLTNTGATAQVGSIVMGIVEEYGGVLVDTSRSQRSRSVKKTEGTLTSLLRRTPYSSVTYKVVLFDYTAASFWRLMDDIEGTAVVFAGPDSHPEFTVYGFHSNPQTVAEGLGRSKVSLEVQSL